MIATANFQPKFFFELYKALKAYGTIFLTEDGNMYRKEKQAQERCALKTKLAVINGEEESVLRYIRLDLNTWKFRLDQPSYNVQLIKDLFDEQEIKQRKSRRNEAEAIAAEAAKSPMTAMSDEDVLKEVQAMAKAEPEATEAPKKKPGRKKEEAPKAEATE